MKCDELKYEKLGDMMPFYPRSTLVIRKQFVDAAIDELKREHHKERHEYIDMVAQLKAKLVEQESENRKLKRALWLARAERAKAIQWHEGLDRYLQERKKYWPSRFCFMANDEMYHVWYKCWCEVERKCRAKAEEYK